MAAAPGSADFAAIVAEAERVLETSWARPVRFSHADLLTDPIPRATSSSGKAGGWAERMLHVLRNERAPGHAVVDRHRFDPSAAFEGVRCPLCAWRPSPEDRWSSRWSEPEPPFPSCGAVWNTFATKGRCPGCSHQWQWTSCFRCEGWSLHQDWYERDDEGMP